MKDSRVDVMMEQFKNMNPERLELDATGEQISEVRNQTRAETGSVNALRLDEDILNDLSDNSIEL